jgi:glycyl-tRNA synthetase alpha subunit
MKIIIVHLLTISDHSPIFVEYQEARRKPDHETVGGNRENRYDQYSIILMTSPARLAIMQASMIAARCATAT